ncbi:MAG TPA: HAD-IIB family hydrolase, partial [Anaerolineae bacterium]|nr:HAD-IIB family hydrolase [Anaerolineae bacterium]
MNSMIDSAKSVPDVRHAFDLVAIDVDGTLLNSRGELSTDVEAAIREARQQGIAVTLVSGRGRLPLSPWLRRLAIDRPYIGSGGSYIAD